MYSNYGVPLALTVVDLLADDAAEARAVLASHTPVLTRAQYLRLQAERFRAEVFSGLPTRSDDPPAAPSG